MIAHRADIHNHAVHKVPTTAQPKIQGNAVDNMARYYAAKMRGPKEFLCGLCASLRALRSSDLPIKTAPVAGTLLLAASTKLALAHNRSRSRISAAGSPSIWKSADDSS